MEIGGSIDVKHNNLGVTITITAQDLGFDEVEIDNKPQGISRTQVGSHKDGSLTVTVSIEEYPAGIANAPIIDVKGGTLVSDNLTMTVPLERDPNE